MITGPSFENISWKTYISMNVSEFISRTEALIAPILFKWNSIRNSECGNYSSCLPILSRYLVF